MFVFANYLLDKWYNGLSGIRYYNSGRFCNPSELWTTKFIESCNIHPTYLHPINITSVFGSARLVKANHRGINIFYTGENIHTERFTRYKDNLDKEPFDLKIGFDYNNEHDYVRFPYWILEHFSPNSTFQQIKDRVKVLRYPIINERERFCSLISRHDIGGIRTEIADSIQLLGHIDFAGEYRNNTNELKNRFSDNKIEYLKQYMFNICPENTNTTGYVTEKLFDAFAAGCIPIYWGADGNPEPDIINQKTIIFYDKDNKKNLINQVKDILSNKTVYQDFIHTPRLLPEAEDIIYDYFVRLKQRIFTLYTTPHKR